MYACLYSANSPDTLLYELALQFSPVVEQAPQRVVFSIAPLRKLIGSPHQIASEISRAGFERKMQAGLAIAANPDSAILLARNFPGTTLVTPGEEQQKLGPIPLSSLFHQLAGLDHALLQVLQRWGLKTCEDLAALPEKGVAERTGPSGVYLRNLARGVIDRPLQVTGVETNYEEHVELEHSLELLEPLLFLFGRVLNNLCGKLRSQSQAARLIAVQLKLEDHEPYCCELEFSVPLVDSRTILKLLQLHLERHSPQAPITAFTLRVDPTDPRRVQGGMFLPPTPSPDKLQLTLARIAGMVGPNNVGTPALLNTHRPDAFEMKPMPILNDNRAKANQAETLPDKPLEQRLPTLQLAMRLFRPALPARVRMIEYSPKTVMATGVKGKVMRSAGPWKTSGEWWTSTFWHHEEWDVALDDGALYRIYQDLQSSSWYVQAVYD